MRKKAIESSAALASFSVHPKMAFSSLSGQWDPPMFHIQMWCSLHSTTFHYTFPWIGCISQMPYSDTTRQACTLNHFGEWTLNAMFYAKWKKETCVLTSYLGASSVSLTYPRKPLQDTQLIRNTNHIGWGDIHCAGLSWKNILCCSTCELKVGSQADWVLEVKPLCLNCSVIWT